jgi:hypothetical protein
MFLAGAKSQTCYDRVNATHVIQDIRLHLKLLGHRCALGQRLRGRQASTVARVCQPHWQSVRTTDGHILPSIKDDLDSRVAKYDFLTGKVPQVAL